MAMQFKYCHAYKMRFINDKPQSIKKRHLPPFIQLNVKTMSNEQDHVFKTQSVDQSSYAQNILQHGYILSYPGITSNVIDKHCRLVQNISLFTDNKNIQNAPLISVKLTNSRWRGATLCKRTILDYTMLYYQTAFLPVCLYTLHLYQSAAHTLGDNILFDTWQLEFSRRIKACFLK